MVGCRTYDQEVACSIPDLALLCNDSGRVVRTNVPVTKQYYLERA